MLPLNQISECLQKGDNTTVAELTRQAIDTGIPATEILDRGLLAGMDVVGRRFGAHEIFLPEVLLAARAMKAGMDLVKPLLVSGDAPSRGKVVLGTFVEIDDEPIREIVDLDRLAFDEAERMVLGIDHAEVAAVLQRCQKRLRANTKPYAETVEYEELELSELRALEALASVYASNDWQQEGGRQQAAKIYVQIAQIHQRSLRCAEPFLLEVEAEVPPVGVQLPPHQTHHDEDADYPAAYCLEHVLRVRRGKKRPRRGPVLMAPQQPVKLTSSAAFW